MRSQAYWIIAAVTLLGLGLNLVLEYEARGRHDPQAYLLRAGLVLTAAAPGFVGLAIADRRHQRSEGARLRRERLDYLTRVLEGSVRKLFPGEDHYTIRANVMVVRDDRLQVLFQWNMEAYPDSRMSLGLGQGVAGAVWKAALEGNVSDFWRPLYAPLAQLSRRKLRSKWRLSDEQIRATAHTRWVLSTPILHRVGAGTVFLGVFNLDGVIRDLDNMRIFEDEAFHLHCVKAAEQVGKEIVLGDLLAM